MRNLKFGLLVAFLIASVPAWALGVGNDNQAGGDVSNTLTSNPTAVAVGGTGGAGGIGIGGTGGTGLGVGLGVAGATSESTSGALAGAVSGSNATSGDSAARATGGDSGGNQLQVNQGDIDAPHIPVGSSIAAGANGTAPCTLYKSKSVNIFFVSAAVAGHELDYICVARELGMPDVAIQLACNTDAQFKVAYNQRAAYEGRTTCD